MEKGYLEAAVLSKVVFQNVISAFIYPKGMGLACKLIHTKSWGILDAPNLPQVHSTDKDNTWIDNLGIIRPDHTPYMLLGHQGEMNRTISNYKDGYIWWI